MTVKELRDLLSAFDENLPVFVYGYEYGRQEMSEPPRLVRLHLNYWPEPSAGGPHEEWPYKEEDGVEYVDAVVIPR